MSGKFWDSRKVGIEAEKNLMSMVKENKNRHKYVSTVLSNFSLIQKKLSIHRDDIKMFKYILKSNLDTFYFNVSQSNLSEDEKTHLKNALHTRYMKLCRTHKLPLNSGNRSE